MVGLKKRAVPLTVAIDIFSVPKVAARKEGVAQSGLECFIQIVFA